MQEFIEILKKNLKDCKKKRLNAFKEFHNDTINKNFNDPKITVGIEDREYVKNFFNYQKKFK